MRDPTAEAPPRELPRDGASDVDSRGPEEHGGIVPRPRAGGAGPEASPRIRAALATLRQNGGLLGAVVEGVDEAERPVLLELWRREQPGSAKPAPAPRGGPSPARGPAARRPPSAPSGRAGNGGADAGGGGAEPPAPPVPRPRRGPDGRRVIAVNDRELHVLADEATEALIEANEPPRLFVRGGVPVAVRADDGLGARLEPLGRDALRDRLSRVARWVRGGAGGGETAVAPPVDVVQVLLARELPLPPLDRVVTAPVLDLRGGVLTAEGYHPESRTYYQPDPAMRAVGRFDAEVAWGDVQAARRRLEDDLLLDFPFASQADRAHAIALLVLPFLRELIDGPTPLHLVEASSPGSGKGLLTEVVLRASLGDVPLTTKPTGEEEMRKRLTSTLLRGPAAAVFDNVSGHLDSPALAAALTAPVWEDRLLGVSEMRRIPVRCAWVATLNNASLSTELARRSVRIRLRPETARPWERVNDPNAFRHPDLRGWARSYRHLLVSAALTLCRWWAQEGMPPGEALLGSFESWSRVVGGVLEAAGIEGFLANREDLYAEADEASGEMADFLEAWERVLGPRPLRARELARVLAVPDSALADAAPSDLLGWRDEGDLARRLGYLLRQHRETVFDGRRLVVGSESRKKGNRWRVERVGEAEA